ncbi:MAG: NADH-quinone oxidoreductase subunit NuoG [Geobacteraceae bacterium]|nr:NADH-quinone oxidoreductase subunit NuoG [Geobacteraceae bacterium]
MPRLIIDDIPVEVPEGTNVLEAARSLGITIPHFCWHPALGKAGACRVCAVKMLDGPVKGLQMSCMLTAQNGMVVSTTDDEAVAMRRSVIEWLMINHPHDCPVCDEGGECQLQDYTIAGGHGIRRYDGLKRTHVNQDLGEQVAHEMNRCIQCYRCARFYQEYAGGTDFGVTGHAAGVYFGRLQNGRLESPFSGNLVDICPTGVFTDKTARFRARYWDYEMAPSVCPHCSLGCNTIPMARYRELLKVTARRNDAVNGWFICDRGRFSNSTVNATDRPRQAMVDGQPFSMDDALDGLVERLSEFLELHGPGSLAIVGSPRMSHEGNIMAARLAEMLGAGTVSYFGDVVHAERTIEAVSLLHAGNSASQEDVRHADLIAVMDCDLQDEAPMMALAVRQAWRDGAQVFSVGSECPINSAQQQLFDSTAVSSLSDVPLASAVRPLIICGTRHKGLEQIRAAAASSVRLAFILEGPNTWGCAQLAFEHEAQPFSQTVADKRVKGIISLEADLPAEMLDGIRVLGAADWRQTGPLARAEVVLPTCAWVEQDGTFINHEGRAQRFKQVMRPGLPIKGLNREHHPPRMHRHDAPGGDILPAWQIVAELIKRLGGEQINNPLDAIWAELQGLSAEGPGVLLNREK